MKSAYASLGVPGNAQREELDRAYDIAQQAFSKERLVERPELAEQLQEVRAAYKLLVDPEARAAHDRKLASMANQATRTPRPRPPELAEASTHWRLLVIGIWGVVALLAVGAFVSHERTKAQEVQLAKEALDRATAEKAALATQRENAIADAERLRMAKESELAERRLRNESQNLANMAESNMARQNAMQAQALATERNIALRAESEARAEERQRAYQAQQRVQQDKQRIRELCYQNYRRYDC